MLTDLGRRASGEIANRPRQASVRRGYARRPQFDSMHQHCERQGKMYAPTHSKNTLTALADRPLTLCPLTDSNVVRPCRIGSRHIGLDGSRGSYHRQAIPLQSPMFCNIDIGLSDYLDRWQFVLAGAGAGFDPSIFQPKR